MRRIETVIQFVSDPRRRAAGTRGSSAPSRRRMPRPIFKFDAHAYLIRAGFVFNELPFDIPPGRLVTLNDPDGNIVGLIDDSKGGMPGQRA